MLGEISAVIIALIGGLAAIFGETWDKKRKRPTLPGWITIAVVLAASASASLQIWNTDREAKLREQRQMRMSYEAYISVYGPLAMWFDDFALYGGDLQGNIEYAFPPPTSKDQYQRLRQSKCRRKGYSEYLAKGLRIENRPFRNDVAESFASRYRITQARLDNAIVAYGPMISAEMLEHFVSLKAHSLFREAEFRQSVRDGACSGWIDQIAMDFTDGEMSPGRRNRCRTIFERLLFEATKDELPDFQLPKEFEALHQSRCALVGYRRPYCRWATPAGFEDEISPSTRGDPECQQ